MIRLDYDRLDSALPLPLPPEYSIRRFVAADWQACISLMLACPDPAYDAGPWDRDLCERSMAFAADENMDFPDGRGQLIFAGDELVAMALCSATGYLNQVYTLEAHRRRGLAAAAVTRVLCALRELDLARCFLMVFTENTGARLCYEALGFHEPVRDD
jgi:ribosomal protein S18 acetylase RimI-like enzyme